MTRIDRDLTELSEVQLAASLMLTRLKMIELFWFGSSDVIRRIQIVESRIFSFIRFEKALRLPRDANESFRNARGAA